MIKFIYKNRKTGKEVEDFMAEDYALEKLGLKENENLVIIPRGKNGEFTIEQLENIEQTVEWFFSGDWIKEEVEEEEEDEDIPNLERDLEIADRIYQENLDRKWGL